MILIFSVKIVNYILESPVNLHNLQEYMYVFEFAAMK